MDDVHGGAKHRNGVQQSYIMCANTSPPINRLRPTEPSPTAGPRGGPRPYVSSEGHSIVDIRFCTSF